MGYHNLPLRKDEAKWYDFTTPLEGRNYRFEFMWNERDSAWYFSLYDQLGDALLLGKKLVPEFPLLTRIVDHRMPPGELTLIDTAGKMAMPGLNDLGRRHVLQYTDAGEIPDA